MSFEKSQHIHAYFSGTVQGVGFRYTVCQYAQQLQVVGWVKNLPDGRVELRAQADRSVLDQLIEKIDSHFQGKIRARTLRFSDELQSFTDFKIVRHECP